MKQAIRTGLFRWHRRIGALILLAVIGWTLSGLLHPLMSRFRPAPVVHSPMLEPVDLSRILPLQQVLEGRFSGIEKARLFSYQGQPFYRLEESGRIHFLPADGRSGQVLLDERTYAIALARHYSGDLVSPVLSVTEVSGFDHEYAFINRLLPVQKVVFDRNDGLRVFVDTESGRLGRVTDDINARMSWLFTRLHTWKFIEDDKLRRNFLLLAVALTLMVSLAGTVLYFVRLRRRPAKDWQQRWHRRAGILVSLAATGFLVSALVRLLPQEQSSADVPQASKSISADRLVASWLPLGKEAGTLLEAELVTVGDSPWFRLLLSPQSGSEAGQRKALKTVYFDASSGQLSDEAELTHARELALHYSDLPEERLVSLKPVHRFNHEYGFVNKRLPVFHAQFSGEENRAVYVETRSGVLAAQVTDRDRLEGYSFAWLHKWRFLDGLGKDARDSIQALFVLLFLSVSLLGGWIFWRRVWVKSRSGKLRKDNQNLETYS